MSLVDRINYLFSSSILRLHGPNKNHDDCFHCQLIIDLKKIRQALTSKEAELQAEREKVSRYNLAVKAIHDINDVVEFQKGAVKEAEQMDRESLISHYVCAVTNWAITLYDRDKAEAELAALRADNAKLQDSLRQFLDGEREIQKENEGLRKRLEGVEEALKKIAEQVHWVELGRQQIPPFLSYPPSEGISEIKKILAIKAAQPLAKSEKDDK